MRPTTRHRPPTHGFSLIELSIVIAILAVVATFGLQAAATFLNQSAVDLTRNKIVVLDKAIANFFRIYGRLPCPADRSLAPSSASYGTEQCASGGGMVNITTTPGGGVWSGAVPFRALNLPMSASIDGFYNKINYAVTKNLTVAGGDKSATPVTGRFGSFDTDNTCTDGVSCGLALTASSGFGLGGIEIRSGILEQPCSATNCQVVANPTYATTNTTPNGAAYILFSAGPDKRGAISWLGNLQAGCVSGTTDIRIDAQNCVQGTAATQTAIQTAIGSGTPIPYNVFYDNRFNNGLNMRNYFDDIVIWRTKGQL